MTFFPDNPVLLFGGIIGLLICIWILGQLILVIVALTRKKQRLPSFTPSIAVIVPAYNEEDSIEACIHAILAADYPREKLSIICVDDGSTDTTRQLLKAIAREDKRLRIIDGAHKGKSAALNTGFASTRAPFIVTVDADTIIGPRFLRAIIAPFADAHVGATHGMGQITAPHGALGWWQETEYAMNNLMRFSFERILGSGLWFFGAAAAFRRTALTAAGGFRTDTLTEDMDVSLAIGRSGYGIMAVESAYYTTQACGSVLELMRQRIRWFGGGLECLLKNRRKSRDRPTTMGSVVLYANHFFWSVISFTLLPLYVYQVAYWWPTTAVEQFWYVFRWLNITGPLFVLIKIPEWGLTFANIFGVSAGIISFGLLIVALVHARRLGVRSVLAAATIFPYMVVLTATWVISVPVGLFVRRGFGASSK